MGSAAVSASAASALIDVLPSRFRLVSPVCVCSADMSPSSRPELLRSRVVRLVMPLIASTLASGLPLRFSSRRAVCPARAAMLVMALFAAFTLSSRVSDMRGEMLDISLLEMSSVLRFGRDARAEMLEMTLPERFRLSRSVHAASAEMSDIWRLERSSSVTSLMKVMPPSVISVAVDTGSSVKSSQSGSSASSCSSCSSVISRPRMSSVVRPSRP